MFLAHGLALLLSTPTEVFEEWSLSPSAPLVEVVTVRALTMTRTRRLASPSMGTRPNESGSA